VEFAEVFDWRELRNVRSAVLGNYLQSRDTVHFEWDRADIDGAGSFVDHVWTGRRPAVHFLFAELCGDGVVSQGVERAASGCRRIH